MDYLSNIISKIRNANRVKKSSVSFPYSKLGEAVATTLSKSGFVGAVAKKGKKNKFVEITLLYSDDGKPVISDLKKISRESKRFYIGVSKIKPVRNGYGRAIMSTPMGVMTGEEAIKANVGGELLFQVW